MHTETFPADADTNSSMHTVLREAARLFEQGIELSGKRNVIEDACVQGASLRFSIDFNMPARMTGFIVHGKETVELFCLLAQPELIPGAEGTH